VGEHCYAAHLASPASHGVTTKEIICRWTSKGCRYGVVIVSFSIAVGSCLVIASFRPERRPRFGRQGRPSEGYLT
jgi:hypothetical protein